MAICCHVMPRLAMIVSQLFPSLRTQKRQARSPMDALGGVGWEPGLASIFNEFPVP